MTPDKLNAIDASCIRAHKAGDIDTLACNAAHLIKEIRGYWHRDGLTERVLPTRHIPISTIISSVCDYYSLSIEALKGRGKSKKALHARQVAAYLAVAWAGKTSTATGKHLDRDHSTVLYSVHIIKSTAATNWKGVADEITAIQSLIAERLEPEEAAE